MRGPPEPPEHKRQYGMKSRGAFAPPPPRRPDRIGYSPSRCRCRSCNVDIVEGEPRVGRLPALAAFANELEWEHLACALGDRGGGGAAAVSSSAAAAAVAASSSASAAPAAASLVTNIEQLAGWDRMCFDVLTQIRAATGQMLTSTAQLTLQRQMLPLEALQDAIIVSGADATDLAGMLLENGVLAEPLGIAEDEMSMAVMVADGMAHGLAQDCAVCGQASLVQCAGKVRCWNQPCAFECAPEEVTRYKWRCKREHRQWAADMGTAVTEASKKPEHAGIGPEFGAVAGLHGLGLTGRITMQKKRSFIWKLS